MKSKLKVISSGTKALILSLHGRGRTEAEISKATSVPEPAVAEIIRASKKAT